MILINNAIYKWFIVALFCCLYTLIAFSQDLKFKRFSREEGLSSVNVKTVFQDSKDFMWIGTQDGLNRYDGYHFKVFKSNINDKNSLPSADISCITEDKDGKLYIGTNGSGLSVYDRFTETFKNYTHEKSNICSDNIKCLLHLNDTELLIGTIDGLSIFNKKSKRAILVPSPLPTYGKLFIGTIYKDSYGTIWVAIPKYGLYQFNPENQKLILTPFPDFLIKKDEEDYYKHAIICLKQVDNILYCGTFSGGIIKYDILKKTFIDRLIFDSNIEELVNSIRNIKSGNSNDLWIVTLGGLVKYDTKTKTNTKFNYNNLDNSSIASNELLCLEIDKQNNLWVGTEDRGFCVNFKSSQMFAHYNKNQLKGNDDIKCFLECKDGLIWIGTDNGLYTFNKTSKSFINQSYIIEKYGASSVWSLHEDDRKNIWIGTYDRGVILYNPITKTSKKILSDDFLKENFLKIIQDSNKIIYIATYQYGLLKIDLTHNKINQYDNSTGLTSNIINDIYESKQDHVFWLSTQDGGINILKFDSVIHKINIEKIYNHQINKNTISSNLIYSVYEDIKNMYWIATNNGLNKLQNDSFTLFTEEEGLPSNCVYSILPDDNGNLWLTTNNGLSCFTPKTKQFTNYNTNNGIQSKEFNQGAAFKCKDGMFLVGGTNGFNFFNPNTIKPDNYQPKVYVYGYTQQGKDVKTDTSILFKKHLNLNYKNNYFTFEVVALDYASAENIKYSYKLEGYNQEWSTPSAVRYISYTELPGGTYILKIKAINSAGISSSTPYQITITVTPPWYKTKWFYALSVLMLGGSVFTYFKYRTNAIKRENKLLEIKVQERTHELAEKNRDITSSIEYAKRIQEAILPAKDSIFNAFTNAFILYKPKDIVSGDFYWFGERNNYKIIAVVDCTGHGVPGAFMSMIGHNLLNQIVSEKGNYDPGIILQQLHKGVQAALKQGNNTVNTNDGMDVSIIAIDTSTNTALWSGAFRGLIKITSEGVLEKIEGNKYPIGGSQLELNRLFTTHIIQLRKNDMLYLFSDGYADQFGGEKGKKFMVKRLHDHLITIHHLNATEQHVLLEQQFNNWKGDLEQVDDVLMIGIKV